MKTNSRKQWAILLAGVAAIASLLACTTSTFIARRELPSAAPVKTLRPTFTTTPAPGMALDPTNTPAHGMASAAANTPMPEDVAPQPGETAGGAGTPVPDAQAPDSSVTAESPPPTSILPPTVTGAPGGATAAPTASPTGGPSPTVTQETAPSATSGPLSSWTGQVSSRGQDCGLTRLLGLTRNRNGELAGDVWVHYWADGGISKWSSSYPSSFGSGPSLEESEANWDGIIGPDPLEGLWHVCVVDANQSSNCLSNRVDVETSSDCRSGHQIVHITFVEN